MLTPTAARALRVSGCLALVGLVYWVTQHAPPDVRLGILYLVPVFLVTWLDGLGWGIVFAVATSALRYQAGFEQLPLNMPGLSRTLNEAAYIVVAAVAVTGLAQVRRTQVRLQELATHDPLTGAVNARTFAGRLSVELERNRRYRSMLALLYIDLDDFKAVNDRHGHATGDAVLRLVADATRAAMRKTDLIGRLGGDEFAVLMPETDAAVASAAAARLAAALRTTFHGPPTVTASIGIVATMGAADTAEQLLRRADQAMYEAKRGGKDRVVHSTT